MRKGILIGDDNDLIINVKRGADGKITSGLTIGETETQNARLIIEAQKGEFKEYPSLGFGIARFLKQPTIARQRFVRELTIELESDNIKPKNINVSEDLQTFNLEL